jgi:hypothetical protein
MTNQEIINWTELMLSPDLDNVKLAFAMLEGMEYTHKNLCISYFLTRFVDIAMNPNVDNPTIWRLREGEETANSVDVMAKPGQFGPTETVSCTLFYQPKIWSNYMSGCIYMQGIWYDYNTHTLYTKDTVHDGEIQTILATDCELWIDLNDDESHVFFNSLVVFNFHKLLSDAD